MPTTPLPVDCWYSIDRVTGLHPRQAGAADDPPLAVPDEPTRDEQVVGGTPLGASRVCRDDAHDVRDLLSRLGQIDGLAEHGLDDRDGVSRDLQCPDRLVGLLGPGHPAAGDGGENVAVLAHQHQRVRGEVHQLHIHLPFLVRLAQGSSGQADLLDCHYYTSVRDEAVARAICIPRRL